MHIDHHKPKLLMEKKQSLLNLHLLWKLLVKVSFIVLLYSVMSPAVQMPQEIPAVILIVSAWSKQNIIISSCDDESASRY